MNTDSINDEILRIKRKLAAQFNNDLGRIVADAKSREVSVISLPPRRYTTEQGELLNPPESRTRNSHSTPADRGG